MSRLTPVVSILLLLVLISGGYFLWWPKYQEFNDKRLELESKDREMEQKEEYVSELKNLSDKLKLPEYAGAVSKIHSALPTDPSIPVLFNFILKTSAENGLILDTISFGGTSSPSEEGIQQISLSISVSGSYPAFKNFLSAIYKNARLIEVNSISFSSPQEKDLFTFGLTLTTYAYQEYQEPEVFE